MKPTLQQLAQMLKSRDAVLICGLAAGVVLVSLLILLIRLIVRGRRPSAEELERRRCDHLAGIGRITDGVILEAHTRSGEDSTSSTIDVLVYSYRIAGVTYNCAQDVSRLHASTPGLHRSESIVDQSVQVRYDPHNPGNSIVVSETWSGLWEPRD